MWKFGKKMINRKAFSKQGKYDKMKIVYEVDHKQVYAKGVLHYLQHEDESVFINLIQK